MFWLRQFDNEFVLILGMHSLIFPINFLNYTLRFCLTGQQLNHYSVCMKALNVNENRFFFLFFK